MITAVAIDDEIPAIKLIENFCNKAEGITLLRSFNAPGEALKYINQFPVDVVFVDINMPSINGLELVKASAQQTMFIFTTAYSEYAVEGFNLNAIDYLLKPFTFKRFQQAVNKAIEYNQFKKNKQNEAPKYIYVRADYTLIKIDVNDIVYIEGLDDYVKIFLKEHKPITVRFTIKNILEKLPPKEFVRIHRSYIVSLNAIKTVRGKTVYISEKELPVGSSFEEDFLNRFNK